MTIPTLVCTLSLLLATNVTVLATNGPEITLSGDSLVLEFDTEHGTSLKDFLDLAQPVLGTPIQYDAADVASVQLDIVGAVSVPRSAFRRFVDRVVRRHDFASWDGDEFEPLITVARVGSSNGRGGAGGLSTLPSQVIPLARLDDEPQRITALYTTVFPLEHIDARSAMATFNPFLDARYETLRNIERSNSLVATAMSIESLRRMRQLLELTDVEPVSLESAQPSSVLEQRVDQLEARVAELEQQATAAAAGSAAAGAMAAGATAAR